MFQSGEGNLGCSAGFPVFLALGIRNLGNPEPEGWFPVARTLSPFCLGVFAAKNGVDPEMGHAIASAVDVSGAIQGTFWE